MQVHMHRHTHTRPRPTAQAPVITSRLSSTSSGQMRRPAAVPPPSSPARLPSSFSSPAVLPKVRRTKETTASTEGETVCHICLGKGWKKVGQKSDLKYIAGRDCLVFGAGRSGQKLAPLGWVEGHRRVWTVSQSVSQINSGVNISRDLN